MNIKTLPSCNIACCFNLRFRDDYSFFCKSILECSYYMLNEVTGQHHKLVNFSPFMTDWFDLGIVQDRMKFMLVFAMDYNVTDAACEYGLEGKTETLNHTNMYYSSGSFRTFINGKEHCLIFANQYNSKSIYMDGLGQDEIVEANLQIHDNRSTRSDRNLQLSLRSSATSVDIDLKEQVNKVELIAIYTDFKNMDAARNSEIKEIIANIDLLPVKPFQNVCELTAANPIQQLQSTTPGCYSSNPNDQTTDIRTLLPSVAVSVAAITPEQTKYMYKCFTESKFCDVSIQVPDGREIRAHKCVLYSGSTVWRKLLNSEDQLSVITVDDLERETIETLITFIYSGSVPKPATQINQLLIAAETYGVDGLKIWCERELMTSITIDSAITLLVLAHRYNAKNLFDEVWIFVMKHIAELKQRKEWKSAFFSYPELAFELFNSIL